MRAILLTAFAALSTLFGGWLALRARKHIHLLLGFGAGVLLGATFFDLLPEAIEAAGQRGWTSREILGLTVVGFLIFYLGQRVSFVATLSGWRLRARSPRWPHECARTNRTQHDGRGLHCCLHHDFLADGTHRCGWHHRP